ncbi:unnamed protein product, partial [Closterium sp. NIES-54]
MADSPFSGPVGSLFSKPAASAEPGKQKLSDEQGRGMGYGNRMEGQEGREEGARVGEREGGNEEMEERSGKEEEGGRSGDERTKEMERMRERMEGGQQSSKGAASSDFASLEQYIEELTEEKFTLQRQLDAARMVAESLAKENSALTDDFNRQ